jgi:DNA-binding transcriptional regulator YdaS (Cro superfamily)
MTSSVRDLIETAARLLGNETKLAAACGVTQNAIWQAKQRGRISPELAISIHWATDKRVSAAELRPDLWLRASHVPARVVA